MKYNHMTRVICGVDMDPSVVETDGLARDEFSFALTDEHLRCATDNLLRDFVLVLVLEDLHKVCGCASRKRRPGRQR